MTGLLSDTNLADDSKQALILH